MHHFVYDALKLRAFSPIFCYCAAHGIPAVLPLRKVSIAETRFACLVFDRAASVLRGIKLEPLPLRVNNTSTNIITTYISSTPSRIRAAIMDMKEATQGNVKKLSFKVHDVYSMACAAYTFDMNPMFSATG